MARADSTARVDVWLHKPSGFWCKKSKGRVYYLSRDQDEAQSIYEANKDRIATGRPLEIDADAWTVQEVVEAFLQARQKRVDSGELSVRTFNDYNGTGQSVVDFFGKATLADELTPDDFRRYREDVAKRRNVVGVGNEVTRTKTIFKWAHSLEHINAPRFGPDFKRPSNKVLRAHRRNKGKKLFTPDEIHALLDECGLHLRAMVLLGINCGFGNRDCGELPLDVVDLSGALIDWWRPKTQVDRVCPLWPETVDALKRSIQRRPEPTIDDAAKLVFVSRSGGRYYDDDQRTCQISELTRSALKRAKVYRGGNGMNFYWLRHTFRTIADETRDQPACNLLMGHVESGISAVYREDIGNDRLRAVTDHVRAWLYGGDA